MFPYIRAKNTVFNLRKTFSTRISAPSNAWKGSLICCGTLLASYSYLTSLSITAETISDVVEEKITEPSELTQTSHPVPPTISLYSAQCCSVIESLILLLVTVPTFGIGFLFLYPYFAFEQMKRAVGSMQVNDLRFQFNGQLLDFYRIWLFSAIKICCTFGVYAMLGYPQRTIGSYIDSHISVVMP